MRRGLDAITWAGPVSVPALSGKGMEGNSLNIAYCPSSQNTSQHVDLLNLDSILSMLRGFR